MISDIIVTAVEVGLLAIAFVVIHSLVGISLRTLVPAKFKKENSRIVRYHRQFNLILWLLFLALGSGVVAANGYLIHRGMSVLDIQLRLLESVPDQFWENLGLAVAQCLMLVLLVKILLQICVHRAIKRIGTAAKNIDSIQANDASIEQLFQFLDRIVSTGAWLATISVCIQLLQLPKQATAIAYWFLIVSSAIALGMLCIKVIPIVVDTLDALSLRFAGTDTPLRFYQKFRYLIPVFKQCLELIIYVGIASLVFRYSEPLAGLSEHANKIMGIIVVYFLVRLAVEVSRVAVDEFVRRSHRSSAIQQQRRLTIAPLLKDCLKYLIYFCAIVAILSIVNIDLTPVLASAGVVGVTVGLGAKNLVEDLVSGFLILSENYYLVGDYIAAGRLEERQVEGIVEAIELRTTKLRHPDGQLQIVRNGDIGSVVNYSKQYIYATVDIPLAQGSHLDKIYPIIEQVAYQMKEENPQLVLGLTQVEGLENLGKSLVLVRTITKVKPGQHIHIQRVLRKLLKDAFDRADIELTDYVPKPSLSMKERF